MSEPVNVQTRLVELRRMRWILLGLAVAFAAVGFGVPLLWAGAVICLVLAVRTEWVIHQGRRLLR